MSTDASQYERTDYATLAKEFNCHLRIGKRAIQFLPKDPSGKPYKLFQIVRLDGWITNKMVVNHIIKENGGEL